MFNILAITLHVQCLYNKSKYFMFCYSRRIKEKDRRTYHIDTRLTPPYNMKLKPQMYVYIEEYTNNEKVISN